MMVTSAAGGGLVGDEGGARFEVQPAASPITTTARMRMRGRKGLGFMIPDCKTNELMRSVWRDLDHRPPDDVLAADRRSSASSSNSCPSFITDLTLRKSLMSASGLPSTITRSA